MAITEEQRVQLTIPAENVDDFRVGLLAEMKSNADGFAVEHAHLRVCHERERRSSAREDRDGRIAGMRELVELLDKLPDEDVDATVSADLGALRFVLEDAGRQLVEQIRGEFQYAPVPIEDVQPLLSRLRWIADQIETVAR